MGRTFKDTLVKEMMKVLLSQTSTNNREKIINAESKTCTGVIMKRFHQTGIKHDQCSPISMNLCLYLFCTMGHKIRSFSFMMKNQ